MSFLWGRSKASQVNGVEAPAPSPVEIKNKTGKSLELVRYDTSTGKFHAGEEALRVLRATSGPVGVVAVCGRARQGKSYILNQLLGRAGGFTVGPTHRPCTKGLWVWSTPVPRTTPEGTPYSLVLLDTEGIDAYDQTGQYSTQIFSLAVLLSSLFVFNQMGGIDEAALDRLSLVTEMTKHIRVRAGGGDDPSELAAFTPSFLWLLRDFYLQLEEDGHRVTPKEYLEAALAPVPGTGAAARAKNEIRASIKSLFPDRDCFTLVRPVNEERELVSLDTLPPSVLRPEFREGLRRLSDTIFARARPKRLDETVVTGPLLAGLVEAYVEAINAGAVPTIATAWQGVAEAESRGAADAAEAAYDAAWTRIKPEPGESALQAAHIAALEEARAAFEARALGPTAIRSANEQRWRKSVAAKYEKAKHAALAQAQLVVEQALSTATKRVLEVADRASSETLSGSEEQRLVSDMAAAIAEAERAIHAAAGGGAHKWQRWSEWRKDVAEPAQRRLAEAASNRAKRAAEEARREAAHNAQQIVTLEREIAGLKSELQGMRQRAERAEKIAAEQAERARGHDAQRAQHDAAQVQRLAEAQRQLASRDAELARIRSQHDSALSVATAAREDALAQNLAKQRELDTVRGQLREALDSRAALEARLAAAETRALSAESAVARAEADAAAAKAAAATATAEAARATAQAAANFTPPPSGRLPLTPISPVITASATPPAGLPSVPNAADVKKMTIAALKQWLMDAGAEARVWEMASKGAKKTDYANAVIGVLREHGIV